MEGWWMMEYEGVKYIAGEKGGPKTLPCPYKKKSDIDQHHVCVRLQAPQSVSSEDKMRMTADSVISLEEEWLERGWDDHVNFLCAIHRWEERIDDGRVSDPTEIFLIIKSCVEVGIQPPKSAMKWLGSSIDKYLRGGGTITLEESFGFPLGKKHPLLKQKETNKRINIVRDKAFLEKVMGVSPADSNAILALAITTNPDKPVATKTIKNYRAEHAEDYEIFSQGFGKWPEETLSLYVDEITNRLKPFDIKGVLRRRKIEKG